MNRPLPICLADTNEWQRTRTRWDLSPEFEMRPQKLPYGDYTLAEYPDLVIVERKQRDDLVQSLTTDRERFMDVVRGMERFQYRFLVAEADISDIALGNYTSGAHPESVLGAIVSLQVDHAIQVALCGDRPHAIWYTKRLFTLLLDRVSKETDS